MPGLDPGINAFLDRFKTWMAGTSLDKPGHDGASVTAASSHNSAGARLGRALV